MKLYNTLSRQKEDFTTLKKDEVKLYTCGLTVYSQPHIGNLLPYIYWDLLKRVLRHQNYRVIHTQNITDVGHLTDDGDDGEDKLQKRANQDRKTAWKVAEDCIEVCNYQAFELLKLQKPTYLVRATDLIDQQIDFVKKLEKKQLTYNTTDGIYFDTSKISNYGHLAKLNIEGLESGKRVESGEKKNPTDFALWKFSPKNEKRDMEWESPWGVGFPGWHLECSTIALETLGEQIDIHCGGIDHIPVHHINEIAQTESLTDKKFSNYWLHNNHLKLNSQKISKSTGNVIYLSDILQKGYDVMSFKLSALAKHYQTEGDFNWQTIDASQNRLKHWKQVACLRHQINSDEDSDSKTKAINAKRKILEHLGNNLDSVQALSTIDTQIKYFENNLDKLDTNSMEDFFSYVDELLGLEIIESTPDISDEEKHIIQTRLEVREQKNWQTSDELRDELESRGIILKDSKEASYWFYK